MVKSTESSDRVKQNGSKEGVIFCHDVRLVRADVIYTSIYSVTHFHALCQGMKMIYITAECITYGPKTYMLPTSNLSLSFLQIDWPAPQDKKRECVAKGKNNQVRWILADSLWGYLPCSRALWQYCQTDSL